VAASGNDLTAAPEVEPSTGTEADVSGLVTLEEEEAAEVQAAIVSGELTRTMAVTVTCVLQSVTPPWTMPP